MTFNSQHVSGASSVVSSPLELGDEQHPDTTVKHEVNTIFNNTRDILLNEESDHENSKELKIVKCTEVALEIENCKVVALIDSGSKITCISEEVYNKYLKYFKVCASFPLGEEQASGFTFCVAARAARPGPIARALRYRRWKIV